MRALWLEQETASEEKVRAAGVEVIKDIDKEPYLAAPLPVYEKYATSEKLKDMVARIQATE
jgi:TRAP-type C4-dicarboxylate transport system substrate-binding protein